MKKLIYDVYYRYEGSPTFDPTELDYKCGICEDGSRLYETYCKGSVYELLKKSLTSEELKQYVQAAKANDDVMNQLENPLNIWQELGIDKPWNHVEYYANFINESYPAAYFSLRIGGYITETDDGVLPTERFIKNPDGLLINEDGERGYKQVYVIKYYGEGAPWVKRDPWTLRDKDGVPILNEDGRPPFIVF